MVPKWLIVKTERAFLLLSLLYHKQTIEFCTTKLKGRNGLTFKLSEFSAEFDDFTGLDNTKMKMSIVVSR